MSPVRGRRLPSRARPAEFRPRAAGPASSTSDHDAARGPQPRCGGSRDLPAEIRRRGRRRGRRAAGGEPRGTGAVAERGAVRRLHPEPGQPPPAARRCRLHPVPLVPRHPGRRTPQRVQLERWLGHLQLRSHGWEPVAHRPGGGRVDHLRSHRGRGWRWRQRRARRGDVRNPDPPRRGLHGDGPVHRRGHRGRVRRQPAGPRLSRRRHGRERPGQSRLRRRRGHPGLDRLDALRRGRRWRRLRRLRFRRQPVGGRRGRHPGGPGRRHRRPRGRQLRRRRRRRRRHHGGWRWRWRRRVLGLQRRRRRPGSGGGRRQRQRLHRRRWWRWRRRLVRRRRWRRRHLRRLRGQLGWRWWRRVERLHQLHRRLLLVGQPRWRLRHHLLAADLEQRRSRSRSDLAALRRDADADRDGHHSLALRLPAHRDDRLHRAVGAERLRQRGARGRRRRRLHGHLQPRGRRRGRHQPALG